ncbi:pre-tRNA nuclear export protein [Gaertneriomyces sp. JEL0708]|nr:pre-tRNA nuclear export protein [Gaertneriomyces sp. JEL0708]
MDDNLEQAVAIAMDPAADANMKAQAIAFVNEIRTAVEGWQICLKLFLKRQSTPQARVVAMDVVQEVMSRRYDTLDAAQRAAVRESLWNYVTRDMDESEPGFIRNKAIQVLVSVFANQYLTEWPTFFEDLLVSLSASGPRSALMVDSFLRISQAIDDEVANQLIARDAKVVNRNVKIKDQMREGAVAQLVATWREILGASYQSNPDIANMCLSLLARYVAWIDINLVANDSFIRGLFQFLGNPDLRNSACECLSEIVAKGMSAVDKLRLIQALNITSILHNLDTDDEEFSERVAKLINILGLELCRVWETSTIAPDLRENAFNLIQQVFPYLIKALGNEYDDTSSHVFPFLQTYLGLLKKLREFGGKDQLQAMSQNLVAILTTIIMKMKYDEEEPHEFGSGAGDTEAMFMEIRQNLKKHIDSIAILDLDLFVGTISSTVCATFDRIASNPGSVSWSEAELALHLIYLFGECAKSQMVYTIGEGNAATISPLGTMLAKMVTSNVSSYPHISVPCVFFENVTRYAHFFESFSQYVPHVLEAFVDKRGMHHDATFVRSRVFYLFRQFVTPLKNTLVSMVDTVLTSISDLLVVQMPSPLERAGDDSDDETTASTFDSQLYIYEAVGILISAENVPEQRQAELLQAVVAPLIAQIEEIMRQELYKQDAPPDNVVFTLQLNHLIRAIGNVSKGFPDIAHVARSRQTVPAWAPVFQHALNRVVEVLRILQTCELIRDAARHTFQRMVGCMGHDILNSVGPLLTAGLLANSTRKELLDFLPFVSYIMHKFKPSVFPVMNELIRPLLERVFLSLNQPVEGTDDALTLVELRRSYLQLLIQIFDSDLEGILVSEANLSLLDTIIQSVLHFVREAGDPNAQKTAFHVLSTMVIGWGASAGRYAKTADAVSSKPNKTASKQKSDPSPKTPLPGFSQFIYQNIVPVLFEVPMSASFDPSDGQCYLVMTEISSLQKVIVVSQGQEYLEYLSNVYLPSIQCPPHMTHELLTALQQQDRGELRKFMQVGDK